jgi:hypothetical protein
VRVDPTSLPWSAGLLAAGGNHVDMPSKSAITAQALSGAAVVETDCVTLIASAGPEKPTSNATIAAE